MNFKSEKLRKKKEKLTFLKNIVFREKYTGGIESRCSKTCFVDIYVWIVKGLAQF